MTLSGYKRRGLITTLLVGALLAVSGLAAASPGAPHPADADAEEPSAPIAYEYLEDQQLLVYWLTGDEPAENEMVDCTKGLVEMPETQADVATADDGEATPQVELAEGCHGVDVTGPNGQINHGTIMSAFVHSLKLIGFEGPRGHAVRELAQSDLGKGDQQVKTGDDTDASEDADDEDADDDTEIGDSDKTDGPPAHANANSRNKKPKKPKK